MPHASNSGAASADADFDPSKNTYNYLKYEPFMQSNPDASPTLPPRSLGICIGASTIKAVEMFADHSIGQVVQIPHECNPREKLLAALREIDAESFPHITVTGRKFRHLLDLPTITETEASEHALPIIQNQRQGDYDALISLGSETFVLNQLNQNGHIIDITTGNKCASGTGEFFLQQIRRMNLSLEEAISQARASTPHGVSGRCSVFCKSDCTHALNKGVPPGRISAGLCVMMADKVTELISKVQARRVILVGGVTRNDVVMDILRQRLDEVWVPDSAEYFEALGAAAFALDRKTSWNQSIEFNYEHANFNFLPPIRNGEPQVTFQTIKKDQARSGDRCLLGLDVGSTTTKAVIIREEDNAVLADVYLRTNGDPVGAARACYHAIREKLTTTDLEILGLGVTGSGRQLAGLHALTEGIINEIIAHATAAVHFNPRVDTIFEIGGQDAKYTHLINGVPADYAMNEACSAGTGSFLEESARESMDVKTTEIADIALTSGRPPNFNDQCAAFISSDIKNASHENIESKDIIAGLVYSICMNYCNRVKGARPVGDTVFMQGGVCYNQAVPMAMANLINKPIVVPPEPGLMGAFGVALEIKKRLKQGLISEENFDLTTLVNRKIEIAEPFLCRGGKDGCDRACQINVYKINGRKYPFGGICNKYYNLRHNLKVNTADFDWVRKRQEKVFALSRKSENSPNPIEKQNRVTVGLNRSFWINTLYPLYRTFFEKLGFSVVMPEEPDSIGRQKIHSSFCYPAELAHGFMQTLLDKNPDFIFLPAISRLPLEFSTNGKIIRDQCSCVIMGSEPYYLRSAFKIPETTKLLTPVLDFKKGIASQEDTFIQIASELGISDREKPRKAYAEAVKQQKEFYENRRIIGENALRQLEEDPNNTGIVLFGRAYNAFSSVANLGIPDKFASRGNVVIPCDCLPYQSEPMNLSMNWASGEELLRVARFVQRHPQLYGVFITNFSCGPDSFLVGYFREIMGSKPSLTLELDSHSADAGIDTRVEAFLDIVERYRRIEGEKEENKEQIRLGSTTLRKGKMYCETSSRELLPLTNRRVKILFPSMGSFSSQAIAAAFRGFGMQAEAAPVPRIETLMRGRGQCSCKECLPLLLTTGTLLEYLENQKNEENEFLLYFMPTCGGNCRFPQYSIFLNKLIHKQQIPDVALLTLSGENSYGGLGPLKVINILRGVIAADIMDDIRNTLYVMAVNRDSALGEVDRQWNLIIESLSKGGRKFYSTLRQASHSLGRIPLRYPLSEAKSVVLAGEIYVRRDEFSCQNLIPLLARHDIIVKRAHTLEWLYYIDQMVAEIPEESFKNTREKIEFKIKTRVQRHLEKRIKRTMAASGLYKPELLDVATTLQYGGKFVDYQLSGGETVLGIGGFFKDIISHVHGVLSIGPFGCMPTRVTEAVLKQESTLANKEKLTGKKFDSLRHLEKLPFLSIESDGNPFPQIIETRIEAFALQVNRVARLSRNEK